MRSIFINCIACKVDKRPYCKQLVDITVSCLVDMLYVTLSNSKCMCAAFRLLYVTEEQSNECEYPVSGSVPAGKN